MKKIAFCFLIYDTIEHEELWNIFFKNADPANYSIYIHYKINTPLQYFEKYKLLNCIPTRYDDYTIPLAYNLLFRTAYTDTEDNYKFCILSGTCIPFKSFDYIYNQLTSDPLGYFNVCPQEQCFPNCNPLLNYIDRSYISKSHNWFILNRCLVKALCFDNDTLLSKQYKNVYAPAEYYYYTYIRLESLDDQIHITYNVADGATTFTNWEGMIYPYVSTYGLKEYVSISEDELVYLLKSKCLFGRKFRKQCIQSLINMNYIGGIMYSSYSSIFCQMSEDIPIDQSMNTHEVSPTGALGILAPPTGNRCAGRHESAPLDGINIRAEIS